jgi:RecB family exonuclease
LAETSVPSVVTPRRTRLVRAADLRAFQRAILDAAYATPALADIRSRCVVVPTHAAATALRQSIEDARLANDGSATALPLIVTRAELYTELHERIGHQPRLLSDFEREALLRRSARQVEADGVAPPFRLRPGLIVEVLRFYDDLRRRHRTVDAFDRLLGDTLSASADYDRGAERLLRQTRFLAAAYRTYEAAVQASGAVDEHLLRRVLLERAASRPITHVIVCTGEGSAEAGGLWAADFDLLARLPGLARIDVIATDQQLAAGYGERLAQLLPDHETQEASRDETPLPLLLAPEHADAGLVFSARDREEELVDVARLLKGRRSDPGRFGVVFQRPLPYLYLARQVFASARIGYETSDALPLAAEPFAAAIDALFSCLVSEYTRGSLVDLLRLPQFGYGPERRRPGAGEVTGFNRLLIEAKYLGGRDALERLTDHPKLADNTRRLLEVAIAIAVALDEVRVAPRASQQLDLLLGFVRAHERMPLPRDTWRDRHLRARGAVMSALERLRDAHAAHDDEPVSPADLAASVRRWIEGQTFAPRTGAGGIQLVDADAARFGAYDELRIVGLVERDWPTRAGRNIFYPASLLAQLGWPGEAGALAASRAAFRDLLRLPRRRVSVSVPNLDDDALVSPSTFVEELEDSGLTVERPPRPSHARMFVHEALALDPVVAAVDGEAAAWLQLRMADDAAEEKDERFRGAAGPQHVETFAVSHLEQYLACPFKYFAGHVLKIDEEREEDTGMSATERGQFLHELLMEFFRRWQEAGNRAITPENVARALDDFRALVRDRLPSLSPLDRALEEARLLGSAAVPGLAERLFAFELEREVDVVERLLEHRLEGEYAFSAGDRQRMIRIRAQADRIDLLADGSLRIIDYKLGRAPRMARALQLPIYGVCAAQHLEGRLGRSWRVGEAGYVAFGEPDVFKPLAARGDIETALAAGQQRLIAAVEGIEKGEFPPRPDEPFICNFCAFASVCRKDYVGDE